MSQNNSLQPFEISRILHAGYLFELGGKSVVFDPIFENPFSKNCFAYPAVEFDHQLIRDLKFDAVFISHYHDDHFSLKSLDHIDRKTPIYLFSIFEDFFSLLKELGFQHIHSIRLDQTISIGEIQITAREALDSDVDSIFHIQASGSNVLHVVDSWIGPGTMDKLLAINNWDLILWPMQTMREIEVIAPSSAEPASDDTQTLPPEWIEQIQQLRPNAIVPSSCQFRFEDWSWYNRAFFPISYTGFERQIIESLPTTKVLRMNPGETLAFDNSSFQPSKERLSWIRPIGDQNVDYDFQSDIKPQTMTEIARMFPALSEKHRSQVLQFCNKGILNRYSDLPPIEESYFEQDRKWQLLVYEQNGNVRHYLYAIESSHIKLIDDQYIENPQNDFETSLNSADIWTTQITELKLHGALSEGESLTSIYLRITQPKPAARSHKDPNEETLADPLQDPLIRCLYDGIIGGYQKAQLKELLGKDPVNRI